MEQSQLYLKFPTMEDKEAVLEYKEEFVLGNQSMAGVGGLDRLDSFETWLEKIQRDISSSTCEEGRVPATQYLTYRKVDNKLVGMIQIRHELNDYLLQFGGHIGDSVRPSEQGKGYATEQICLALEECRKLNIYKVLITCKKSNVASAKTIIKNNGTLENEVDNNGDITQRYWIDLEKNKIL